MDWFNNRRLVEPIGNIPPAEAEERYCGMLFKSAMAAQLKLNGLRQTRVVQVYGHESNWSEADGRQLSCLRELILGES